MPLLAWLTRYEVPEAGARPCQPGREAVPWSALACLLTLARFCAPSSELRIAESWYEKTALDDLLGVAPEFVSEGRLYRALDALLPHKEKLFGTTFDLLLYDITST